MEISECSIYPILFNGVLIIFHCEMTYLVRHWRTVLESSVWTPTTKEGKSSLDCLKDMTACLSWIFEVVFYRGIV